jgi:hypothetical protein
MCAPGPGGAGGMPAARAGAVAAMTPRRCVEGGQCMVGVHDTRGCAACSRLARVTGQGEDGPGYEIRVLLAGVLLAGKMPSRRRSHYVPIPHPRLAATSSHGPHHDAPVAPRFGPRDHGAARDAGRAPRARGCGPAPRRGGDELLRAPQDGAARGCKFPRLDRRGKAGSAAAGPAAQQLAAAPPSSGRRNPRPLHSGLFSSQEEHTRASPMCSNRAAPRPPTTGPMHTPPAPLSLTPPPPRRPCPSHRTWPTTVSGGRHPSSQHSCPWRSSCGDSCLALAAPVAVDGCSVG